MNKLFYIAVTCIRVNLKNIMYHNNIKITKEYQYYETFYIKKNSKNKQFITQ